MAADLVVSMVDLKDGLRVDSLVGLMDVHWVELSVEL
jgi:hypothetical protein